MDNVLKKVLLIDDDPIFNFLHTRMLSLGGLAKEVHTALNGKQALDLLNDYFSGTAALPDAILLDLTMPELDGFGFLEAIKKLRIPNIDQVNIIVITSSINPRDLSRAHELGITNYLVKPITLEKLRDALEANPTVAV
jgi:CheY-like chemotaxis protein